METMRSYWNSFLPLTIALFWGVVDCQRDLAGRLAPYPSFRTDAGNRGMTQFRFQQNQGRFVPRTKVQSLFQVHGSSSTLDHVPVTPQTNAAANARIRNPAERELRKQNSAPAVHKLPSLTNVRSQSSNPRRNTATLSRGPSWTLQQRTPSVNLVRNGPQPRTAPQVQTARGRMVGPNVCGGQCCSGWTTAPRTNRCIKPVCDPPCQNKGSCSRPQLCICRSGFRGSRCEEVIPEEEYHPPGLASAFQPPAGALPKRINNAEKREPQLPTIQKLPAGVQNRSSSLVTSQSYTGSSRTVRRYPAVNHDHLTSNILPNGNGFEQSSTGTRMVYQEPVLSPWGANLTEKIRKIKIVFTPTICKQTCHNGHCYNNCEKGDTTTLYSQSGHDHDPKSGFRIYFCQIPCLNGGRCVGRDECWCPSNSTGKFCHLPVLKAERKQIPNSLASSSVKHSMYTLPLSNQLASIYPSLVNVHIKHPPEATVQIHQVARVKSDSEQSEENSVESVQIPQLPVASHSNNNATPSSNVVTESNQQQMSQGFMGKCYLETVHGKCADPLPGLARYEDCCGSVGAFWGLSRCIPCPVKPAYPTIENEHIECPQGYKKLNQSHCQDINECTIQGICKNAECMNTRGSFICTCKPGTMLDPSRSHCISDKAVSTEQGSCYRSVIRGMCTLPLNQRITKQICCCSRVGQGWGRNCEICPLLGSETFKEICPAGHGYTYANSDIRMSLRKAEVDELPSLTSEEQRGHGDQMSNWTIRQKEVQEVLKGGAIDIFSPTDIPERKAESPEDQDTDDATQETDTNPVDISKNPPLFPVAVDESAASRDTATVFTEINPCSSSPDMCGPGTCVNFPEGYTCLCYPGYQQHPSHTYCIDIDECERNPCDGKGHCVNAEGSYSCICFSGYSILTSQNMQTCQDLNECDQPDVCHGGQCINIPGSYHCECKIGYFLNHKGQCEDIDECTTYNICPRGRCINTEGSFSCVDCGNGYIASMDGRMCEDIDECSSHMACPQGICINTPGSFTCQACEIGYVLSSNRQSCEDSNECEYPNIYCLGGECLNTPGSYTCHCQLGFELFNGTTCEDQNECLDSGTCNPNGECLNSHGSYFCICALGFSNAAGGVSCQDVDECADHSRCLHGRCINTEGSYSCLCQTGFQHSQETDDCVDVDECEEFGATACGIWQCQNTLGSFHCIMGCPPGFHRTPFGECIDIDECANETLCGSHGFCDNTVGSFHCLCDRGYTNFPSSHDCIDVNECELMIAVCGTALCENVEGAFLCLCPSDHEEYDTETGECRSRSGIGEPGRSVSLHPDNAERKECYYHISDVPLCDSVLANNTTKEECCCTEGAAWGDNCETYLCPIIGSVEYIDICPSGKGYIPVEGTLIFGQTSYTDANECEMFGSEVCRNGHCVNTVPGYTCFCHIGYFYHSSQFACVDLDECENEEICANGKCLNTAGSYHCFCSLPLVLDVIHNRCVNVSNSADNPNEPDSELEICWQKVSTNYVCSEPLLGRQTTYSECCCHYGEAWSRDCALCPPRSSDDFYQLCNIVNEAGLRERPSYEYGSNQDSHQYELYIPDLEPYLNRLDEDGATDTNKESNAFEDSATQQRQQIHPEQTQPRYMPEHIEQYSSFEGLQVEECGILNGCENGRCVRLQEGYTCDCFDGFQLDLKLMACVDINECEAANASMILCNGNACENTEGSYRCTCSPGSAALVEPRCIPETAQNPEAA
ncbi:latent-transforming growth factor beta-binding protein 2 [Pantherophis guttatus]|uniref:Latent-transforming growth factor beta-binding protein 2 n=1 Tax=Pantherophis guttatus TaxID=94885 RepID=A0ABM3Z4U5_PANGU|nr:latent-transforming growth factor beta-binding protein 2 [Pantherophis guttatus]